MFGRRAIDGPGNPTTNGQCIAVKGSEQMW